MLLRLLLLVALVCPPAQANFVRHCGRRLAALAFQHLTIRIEKSKLVVVDHSDHSVRTLGLAETVGSGWRGRVYAVSDARGWPGLPVDRPLVVKMPHAFPLPFLGRFGWARAETELRREAECYRVLRESLDRLRSDPDYPSEPAWAVDRLPIAPLFAAVHTDRGTLLFKQRVPGTPLSELMASGPLSADMTASLAEIRALAAAIERQLTIPSVAGGEAHAGKAFRLDVNKQNFVWVTEKQALAALGLSRPSFVLYEATPLLERAAVFPVIGNMKPRD